MFPTTRRSVLIASRSGDPVERKYALDLLIAAYWKPAFKYLQMRWRLTPEDAQDLTQEFFTRAMEKSFFESYDPTKAAFRTYLRLCLDGFVSNEWKAAARRKRSGERPDVPLDGAEAVDQASLDEYFHREWVRNLFEMSLEALRAHYADRDVRYRVFERYDLSDEPVTYVHLAAEFGLTTATVTNYLAAARRQFRRILIEKLRAVTATEREFQQEARLLLGLK